VSLADLLRERGIERALIVDDALDAVPRPGDLQDQAEQWAIFSADILPDQEELIAAEAPGVAELTFSEKIARQEYVAAVWRLRGQLGAVADALFETYDSRQRADLRYVDLARDIILGVGLQCDTAGRDFETVAADAKLILIDLYLGGEQNEAALEASMRRLGDVVRNRKANPPLVVLMSRSNKLHERRDEFRDEVGLVESGFRILEKRELDTVGRLERQIFDLVDSLPETLKLARFFDAIETDVARAAARTLKDMRRLSLSDIAQIQQLLLEAEEAPAGSYLVDVFDRVLQHEVESEEAIISAALELNDLTPDRHPPAFASGSLELQKVVSKTLAHARQRLRLPATPHSRVTFGDLLRVREIKKRRKDAKGVIWPSEGTLDRVLLVITPVCDLQHGTSPNVLLLAGDVQPLGRDNWSYKGDTRTSAIEIDEELVWIKWDLKTVETVSHAVLNDALDGKRVAHVARLREGHAMELQQAVLSGLGRVGLLAPLPAVFPVEIDAFRTNAAGDLVAINVPDLADGGMIWSGRDKAGNTSKKLVMRATASLALQEALMAIDAAEIHSTGRGAFRDLQRSGDLLTMLTRGVNITKMGGAKWFAPERPARNPPGPLFLLLGLNLDTSGKLNQQDSGKAGVVLNLRGRDDEDRVALEQVIRPPANVLKGNVRPAAKTAPQGVPAGVGGNPPAG
jgi:hypothetical protein